MIPKRTMWTLCQRLCLPYLCSTSLSWVSVYCVSWILNIYLLMHRTNDSTWCWGLVSCEILIPIKFVFGVLSSYWQVPVFFHIILPTQSWFPRCCHLVGVASYYENNPITILTSFLSKVMSGLLIYLFLPSFLLSFINKLCFVHKQFSAYYHVLG